MTLLTTLSAFVPTDRGTQRLAADVAYGPDSRMRLDIYAPNGRSPEKLPVIVFFYGGAWDTGSKAFYSFAGAALAKLGYVVFVPDYRLIPDVEYPEFLEDCADAVAWVRANAERYGGDAERLVLMGHSAGAYNAAMIAMAPHYRHRVGRPSGFIGMCGPYDFLPFDGPISLRIFGAVPNPKATQPLNHANDAAPPSLLIFGEKDTLVGPQNSRHLAAKLNGMGVRADLRGYSHMGHIGPLLALTLPLRWRAPILRECAQFLADVVPAIPTSSDAVVPH